jgi:hypothetical protein
MGQHAYEYSKPLGGVHPTPPSPKPPEVEPDPELEPDDEPDPELEPLLAPDDPPKAMEPLDDPLEAPELPDEAAGLPVASPSEEGAPETAPASSPPAGAGLEPHPEPAGGEAELHEARTIAATVASIERRRSFCLSTFMFGSSCAPVTGARISSASPSEAVPPGKLGASTALESLNNLRRTIGAQGAILTPDATPGAARVAPNTTAGKFSIRAKA